MNRTLARAFSVGILAVCTAAIVTSVVARSPDPVPKGMIVVVGDPDAPQMRQVIAELETRRGAGDPLVADGGDINIVVVAIIFVCLGWVGVGVMIVWRQPSNWAGWLFVIIGAPFPVLALAQTLVVRGLKVDPGSVPLIGLWAMIGEYSLYPLALIPLLFLLYPDGHLPSKGWRWSAIGLLGGTALAMLSFLLRPGPYNNWRDDGIVYENPFGIPGFGWGDELIRIGTVIALVSALSTVIALIGRYRHSSGDTRRLMRPLIVVGALAGTLIAALLVLGSIFEALGIGDESSAPIFPILLGLAALTVVFGVPIAYLIAIFRHGLWDLQVVIRKTVVYAMLAVLLLLVGIAFVWVVTGLFASVSGGQLDLVAGVVIGILVWPLRRVAARIADRIVFGGRATPYEVLTAFSGRVGETYSSDDVLPRMAEVLARGVGAERSAVWLLVAGELRPAAVWPGDAPPPVAVPWSGDTLPGLGDDDAVEVHDRGELLGALSVVMPATDPMTPSKSRLVRDLAGQAGPVLRNVRLIEELRASRQRLVAAQDEERRKIERNIHDGAQQQLVALAVRLKLLEGLIAKDPDKAASMVDGLQEATRDALEDLRDLARGIYPPLLADKGLHAALEAQARKAAVPVVIEPDGDGVGRYPQQIESAVYFSVLEALQNIAKYAGATRATVRLSHDQEGLTFEVADDGRGFDTALTRYGTGLQGIADRLAALGGSLEVVSAPGGGTTLAGRIPVAVGSSA